MTTLDITSAVERATRGVVDNDGATVSVIAGVSDPSVGYSCANGRHESTTDIEYPDNVELKTLDVRHDIWTYADAHRAELAQTGAYLGAWVDDGYLVLDVVSVFPERNVALNRARELGERAIFDLARGETLWTADYLGRDALNRVPRLQDSHGTDSRRQDW